MAIFDKQEYLEFDPIVDGVGKNIYEKESQRILLCKEHDRLGNESSSLDLMSFKIQNLCKAEKLFLEFFASVRKFSSIGIGLAITEAFAYGLLPENIRSLSYLPFLCLLFQIHSFLPNEKETLEALQHLGIDITTINQKEYQKISNDLECLEREYFPFITKHRELKGEERRILELLEKLNQGDHVLSSETIAERKKLYFQLMQKYFQELSHKHQAYITFQGKDVFLEESSTGHFSYYMQNEAYLTRQRISK